MKNRAKYQKDFDDAIEEEEDNLKRELKKLEKRFKESAQEMDPVRIQEIQRRINMARKDGEQRLQLRREELEQEKDQKIEEIETKLNLEIRLVQHWYKLWAVLLPLIPPLLVALIVFFNRRSQEREGVSRERMR